MIELALDEKRLLSHKKKKKRQEKLYAMAMTLLKEKKIVQNDISLIFKLNQMATSWYVACTDGIVY